MTLASARFVARLAVALVALAFGSARADVFVDRTAEAGLALTPAAVSTQHLVAAVSVADVDGDGALDVVLTGGNRPPTLFLQTAPLVWTLVPGSIPAPPPAAGAVHGHTLFDMDGDGDLDLLLLLNGRDVLLENLGDATFADVSRPRLPGHAAWSMSAAAADLDGDGDLDLVVANYIARVEFPFHDCAHNRVLENDGRGVFHDRTDGPDAWAFTLARPGCSFLVGALDLDGDRALDLLVVNDFAQFAGGQELWQGAGPAAGGLAFTERAAELGLVAPIYGMGLAAGVAPTTGRLELALTNIGAPFLFERGDDGAFSDLSSTRGAGPTYAREAYQTTWAAEHEDLDGDGWPDLLYAGGHLIAAEFIENPTEQGHVWLRGGPDGRYVEVPLPDRLGDAASHGRDLAVVDVDGDGRVDVFVAELDGRVTFYRNEGAAPPALRLTLTPRLTGPNAAGARVDATCGDLVRTRHVAAGRFYGAAEANPTLLFAFPPPCDAPGEPVALRLTWPSGLAEHLATTTGATLTATEPDWLTLDGQTVVVDLTAHAAAPPEGAQVAQVAWTGDGVDVGPALEDPPGVWTATWTPGAGAGAGRLILAVDGTRWGAHPRVTWPAGATADLRTTPRRLVAGAPFDVFAEPRDAAGAPLPPDAPVGLRLADVDHPLAHGPDGWSALLATPDAPGLVSAQLLVAGAPHGAPETWSVAPRVDPDRSILEWRELYVGAAGANTSPLLVRAYLVDVNGAKVAIGAQDVALDVNDGAATLGPTSLSSGAAAVSVRFEHAQLADGDRVRLRVHGVTFEPAQRVTHLATPQDALEFVDAARSSCALSEPWLRADGQDRGLVVALLRDAGGVEVPATQAGLTWVADHVTLGVPMPTSPGGVRLPVIAGTTPGEGALTLALPGDSGVVRCAIPLVAPPPLSPLSPTLSGLEALDDDGVLEQGLAVALRIVPRDEGDRAVGSGLDLAVVVSQGVLVEPPRYLGLGRYEALATPTEAGTFTVTVTHADPHLLLSASWPVVGEGEDLGPADADATSPADTVPVPDTVPASDTVPDTVPGSDTVPASDTVPDTAPASDTVPDTVPDTAPDTAPAPDTGTPPDTRPPPSCGGCATASPRGVPALLLALALALALLLAHRRRRMTHRTPRQGTV